MNLIKYILLALMLICSGSCGKLKFVAIKKPHFALLGLKVHKPKLFGLKHGFGGGGFGGGGFGGGGFGGGAFGGGGFKHHEHHEVHESHHSGGAFGGGAFGGLGGWLGK